MRAVWPRTHTNSSFVTAGFNSAITLLAGDAGEEEMAEEGEGQSRAGSERAGGGTGRKRETEGGGGRGRGQEQLQLQSLVLEDKHRVPGLNEVFYIPNFISEDDAQSLLDHIHAAPKVNALGRK